MELFAYERSQRLVGRCVTVGLEKVTPVTARMGRADLVRLRAFKRLGDLTERAVEVLAEGMESPDERVRVTCAQEVLNRRFGKPKQEAEVKVEVQDMATLHLQALKALAEQGLRSIENQAPTLDLEPANNAEDNQD